MKQKSNIPRRTKPKADSLVNKTDILLARLIKKKKERKDKTYQYQKQ